MDMTSAADDGFRRLFKRCVQCAPGNPQCPVSCPSGEICSLVPRSCSQCAHMTCITNPTAPPPSNGPNVGAIAGGVVGGIAFVCAFVFFLWLFWIRRRRAQQDEELKEEWEQDQIAFQKRRTHIHSIMQQDGMSTRTRGSLANSMLSRASNFIQIAYIPGVTNRNGSGRNSRYAPVPPVPAAFRQGQTGGKPTSPLAQQDDSLLFGIDDLRGSTYSGGSSVREAKHNKNRDTRYTMQSITPSLARSSVASDVQWDNATTAPMPSLVPTAPRVVSVKSSPNPGSVTSPKPGSGPDSPTGPGQSSEVPVMVAGEGPSPNSSIRGKAIEVIVGGKKSKGRFPVRQPNDTLGMASSSKEHAPSTSSPLAHSSTDEKARSQQSLLDNIDFATPPAVQPVEFPFFHASDLPSAAISAASSTRPNPYASMAWTVGMGGNKRASTRRGGSKGKIGALSAVIEEATKRASAASGAKPSDPFADEHATGT